MRSPLGIELARDRFPIVAAVDYGGNFEVPPVGELFNFPNLFNLEVGGVNLGFGRPILIMLTGVAISIALFYTAFAKPKLVPGKVQAAAEGIVEFVRDSVAIDIMGPDGRKFVPFLVTIFMFVWLSNLFEIIPFVNFPATSRIGLPFLLAIIVLITFVVVGFRSQGASYVKEIAFPPGVPWPVYFLLTPIELISTFVLRPLTLTIRLFANMVAGHVLLSIVFIATHAFFRIPGLAPEGSNLLGLPIGILTFLISPLAIGFELFIGLLQAYVFIILTSVYLSGALHPEH